MRLMLPVPPSVNELYAPTKRGGRYKTKKYRAWLSQAGWYLLMASPKPEAVSGPYRLSMRVPATMQGDVDNRLKAMLDFLVNTGLTDDDRWCRRATVERDEALTIYAEIEVEAA